MTTEPLVLHEAQKQIAIHPARFRVVCAGRRFGKTELVIDQMKARAAIPNSRVAYIAPCYDDQTEILTDQGWKLFSDLDASELVATYEKGNLVYRKPEEYFEYDYDGDMVGIQNNLVDQLVTPHHRCLVKNHRKGDWHIKTAEEIENTWTYRFKKTAPYQPSQGSWQGEELEAAFWGWYVSEGYARKRYKNGYELIITQCKEEYIPEIRTILTKLKIEFTEDKRTSGGINFRVAKNKNLTEMALKLGKSHQKHIPQWILKSDVGVIRAFLDAYWKGDGHFPKNSYDYKRAETKSKLLADQLQECIIKLGESATVRPIKGRPLWSVAWLNPKFNEPLIRKPDYYRIPYKGKVYCVKVPSGVVLVRRNGKHYFSGNTYQQARDIAWAKLKKDCEQAAESINESRLEVVLVNGSSIVLRGWENIETLRGQNFHLIVIDEIAMMRNFWINWREVIRPTLTDFKGEGIFISTPKGFNHFYDLFNMENDPIRGSEYKSFHFSTFDNPHMPKDEIEAARKELTEDAFAQEYLADFRKTEGLVYKEFNRAAHVVQKSEKEWLEEVGETIVRTYGGVDFGFVHPAAVMTVKETSDGKYFVSTEWVKTGQTDEQIAEHAASLKFNAVYPDPANPGGIQELKRQGCNVREVVKGRGSVMAGINIVRELLKSNRLFIHNSCSHLIWEFETYSYMDEKDMTGGERDESPLKENDDALDALRYVLMMVNNKKGYNRMVVRKPRYAGFNKRS